MNLNRERNRTREKIIKKKRNLICLPASELVTFHISFLLKGPQVAVADLGILLGAEGKNA